MFSGPNLNDVNWPIKVGLEKKQDNYVKIELIFTGVNTLAFCFWSTEDVNRRSPISKAMENNFSTKGQMTMESVRAINTRNFGRLILMSETQPRNYIPVDEADCNSMFLTSLRE